VHGAGAPGEHGEHGYPDIDLRFHREHGAKLLRDHLPAPVLDILSRWRRTPTSWLTISNLPEADEHVPTPLDGFCDLCDESLLTVVNLVHFGLLDLLGLAPLAYTWENDGRLIRNVVPLADSVLALTSWGFARGLDWHTDDSVLDHRAVARPSASIPDFLTFYGIRNTERVPTRLLPVDTVLAALPGRVAEELRRPEFAVTAPESYVLDGSGVPLTRTDVPLLWTLPDGGTALRYGPGRVSGLTPWARAALDWFEGCVEGLEGMEVMLEAGTFHLFDNRRVMHRRDPFEPTSGGEARWLRRVYANGPTA
jgi:hypothetical protein